jgi:hypothetical protein
VVLLAAGKLQPTAVKFSRNEDKFMMRLKFSTIALCLAVLGAVLAGCSGSANAADATATNPGGIVIGGGGVGGSGATLTSTPLLGATASQASTSTANSATSTNVPASTTPNAASATPQSAQPAASATKAPATATKAPATVPPPTAGSGGSDAGFGGGAGTGPEGDQSHVGAHNDPVLPGDNSGAQSALSAEETALQQAGAVGYGGYNCGVGVDTGACLCTSGTTMTASFNFLNTNQLLWTRTAAGETTQITLQRQGKNTWLGTEAVPANGEIPISSITLKIVIFSTTGFQTQTTVVYTSGVSGTCYLNWQR